MSKIADPSSSPAIDWKQISNGDLAAIDLQGDRNVDPRSARLARIKARLKSGEIVGW